MRGTSPYRWQPSQRDRSHLTVFASAGDDGAAQPSCDGSSYTKSAASPAPHVTDVRGRGMPGGWSLTSGVSRTFRKL